MNIQINVDSIIDNQLFEGHIAPDGEIEELLLFAFDLNKTEKVKVWGRFNRSLDDISVYLVKENGSTYKLQENQIDTDDLVDKLIKKGIV